MITLLELIVPIARYFANGGTIPSNLVNDIGVGKPKPGNKYSWFVNARSGPLGFSNLVSDGKKWQLGHNILDSMFLNSRFCKLTRNASSFPLCIGQDVIRSIWSV